MNKGGPKLKNYEKELELEKKPQRQVSPTESRDNTGDTMEEMNALVKENLKSKNVLA